MLENLLIIDKLCARMKHNLFLIILLCFFGSAIGQGKVSAVGRLNNYSDSVLKIVNNCSSQDNEITKAIKEKNAGDIEKRRIALLQCATEGIKELTAIKSFDGDPALIYSSRETLNFYKQIAEWDIPQIRDFFIMEKNFLKAKKDFKKKSLKKYSQAEIYAYNNEVKKYNEGVLRYTQFNEFIANSRKKIWYNWNASQKLFMDTHRAN